MAITAVRPTFRIDAIDGQKLRFRTTAINKEAIIGLNLRIGLHLTEYYNKVWNDFTLDMFGKSDIYYNN